MAAGDHSMDGQQRSARDAGATACMCIKHMACWDELHQWMFSCMICTANLKLSHLQIQ